MNRGDIDDPEEDRILAEEMLAIEELERFEEAEIAESWREKDNEKAIKFIVEHDKPDQNLLIDSHIEGRIWMLMCMELMLESGTKITIENIKANIEEQKRELSDIKRFEILKDEWEKAVEQMEEDLKYV